MPSGVQALATTGSARTVMAIGPALCFCAGIYKSFAQNECEEKGKEDRREVWEVWEVWEGWEVWALYEVLLQKTGLSVKIRQKKPRYK